MAFSIPLHAKKNTTRDQRVLHRQGMANLARVMNGNGDLAGFRPGYMERVLVRLGQADPSLLDKPLSRRQVAKRKAKKAFLERMRGLVDGKPVTQSP